LIRVVATDCFDVEEASSQLKDPKPHNVEEVFSS
jgi:hypothetical protein